MCRSARRAAFPVMKASVSLKLIISVCLSDCVLEGDSEMKACDVMTNKVVAVGEGTPLKEAARIMLQRRISGLPVIDSHENLVGILTEGDLLRRIEMGTDSRA